MLSETFFHYLSSAKLSLNVGLWLLLWTNASVDYLCIGYLKIMIKMSSVLDFSHSVQYRKMWMFLKLKSIDTNFFCIFLVIKGLLLSKYSYRYLIQSIPGICIIPCLFICIFKYNHYFWGFFFPWKQTSAAIVTHFV